MRIYAVADIHADIDRCATIETIVKTHQPDMVIFAGDMTSYWKQNPFLNMLTKLSTPCAGILGNSDFKSLGRRLEAVKHFHMLGDRPFGIDTINIYGISGTIPLPFASRICIRENTALNHLGRKISSKDILVAHPPPRGVLDQVGNRFSAGSANLNRFIEYHQPTLLLCGHIHEQAGAVQHNQTWIVNCAMGRNTFGEPSLGMLIDIDENGSCRITPLTAA